jgi:hypothetical protein
MSIALRFFGRIAVPAFVACLAACSGGSTPTTDLTSAPGSPSSSGGASNVIGNEGTTAASAVPGQTATRFELANTFCGAAAGSCAGNASVQIVDFAAGTLETHTCVELKKDGTTAKAPVPPPGTSARFGDQRGDAITVRSLTAQQITTLREALDGVHFAPAKLSELDGAMTVLSVEAPTGNLSLTPVARCGGPDYDQIVSGLPALSAALDAP